MCPCLNLVASVDCLFTCYTYFVHLRVLSLTHFLLRVFYSVQHQSGIGLDAAALSRRNGSGFVHTCT